MAVAHSYCYELLPCVYVEQGSAIFEEKTRTFRVILLKKTSGISAEFVYEEFEATP